MLFALDIDGTIAVSGNWLARWLAQEAQLAIPEDELAQIRYGIEFWDLPQVRALPHEQRAQLRAHAHHKDPDRQENNIPIPGAREALHTLLKHGATLIYTTCRQPESAQRTRAWLERYDFPCTTHVYICQHYHHKYIAAYEQAQEKEPVLLIDDLIEKMVPAFRTLAIEHRDTALSLVRRLAVVAIGHQEPPAFQKVPFKVLALPSWRPEDVEKLAS